MVDSALPSRHVSRFPGTGGGVSKGRALLLGALLLLVFTPLAMAASDLDVEATRDGESVAVARDGGRKILQLAGLVVCHG